MTRAFCNRIGWAALALAFPIALLADLSSTTTLTATQSLNLDTGATATSGGDILWNGSTVTPQGTAKAGVIPGITGASGFALLDQATLQALSAFASSSPIPSSSLPVGTIFAVITNAAHVSKVLVTANSGASITLQFFTFGAAGGSGGGPSITNVLNNSSEIPAGFPNSGIAQGTLFKILGSGLADAGDANLHDSVPGLPSTLNGASINVQSGSTTAHPAMYYATPTQIDGVLPSGFPTGPATVTVSYKGVASNSFTINVVAAAPGITTYNSGATVVAQDFARPTDAYGGLVTFQKSAVPGGIITIWGSGFGATGNSDTTYDTSAHQTSIPYQIYIGGVQVTSLAYKGASVYPGVDIFVLTIPTNVPTGCYVPVAAVANGNIVSNIATLPIKAGGGTCSDPQLGINGDQISSTNGQPFKSGFLIVTQSTAPVTGVSNTAAAIFQQTTGVSQPGGGGIVSIGGCIISQTTVGGSAGLPTGLNAGTITVTGPGGSPVTLTGIPQFPGFYTATLASIPSTGGAYVFNGTAGSQVGAFTATVTFPNPLLVWTNQSAAANVARSQGLSVTWTGGAPGSYVIISGSAANQLVSGSYTCFAPQSALQFTVPSYVLLGLPAGNGTTTVQNSTNLGTFSASGLDFGGTLGAVSFSVNTNHQ